MTKKRITEGTSDGNKDAMEGRPKVNRSRRRFTSATLSASAIMTLASRPAFATACSDSTTESGDASKHKSAPACAGNLPRVYLDKNMWPPGFYAGEENPIASSLEIHAYPDFHTLEEAIEATPPGPLRDACVAYKNWAWPDGGLTTVPSPIPAPDTFDVEFASAGLTTLDATMTLMQVLEAADHDSLEAHAVAALFNCYIFGREAFGYDADELKEFISESDPSELLAALKRLNGR